MLDELTVDPDPIRQFNAWLDEARAAGISNADAMAVATVGADGSPSARFVLLKGADRRGFVFYTNLGSRKAEELGGNPRAALLFYWVDLGRQVRVEGLVEPTSRDEAAAYFRSRPRGSRIGAWASPQSHVISSRAVLEQRVAELDGLYPADDVPLPPFWGGYRLVPRTIELWEHRDNRLHDRLLYTSAREGWTLERLAP